MNKKIIIAGGGTGGHIFPAIAIANAFMRQQPGTEILFVGAKGKMEMEKVPQAGYEIKGLDIAGFNRSSLWKNIGLPVKLLKSFRQVKNIIDAYKPDAVIGVGGYSSFPVLRYAQTNHIPTFIHESNSFGGKSNILLSKKATRIFVGTEGMEKFFAVEKIMVTGNPVRKSIVNSTTSRQEAIRFFGLDDTRLTVLVIGGSLGAASINEVIAAHIQEFAAMDIQLIWQTGKHNTEAYKQRGKPFSNVWVDAFINEMDKAYAAADMVISRAGAMSVAEITVAGKPAIFVPYPHAAEDHQTANAQHLVNRQAAMVVKDADAPSKLFPTIIELAKNKETRERLQKNISALAITDADEVIVHEILKEIN